MTTDTPGAGPVDVRQPVTEGSDVLRAEHISKSFGAVTALYTRGEPADPVTTAPASPRC